MALNVPLMPQEHPWTCLPACIRMVLAYRGKLIDEAEIAAACRTVPLRGTQIENDTVIILDPQSVQRYSIFHIPHSTLDISHSTFHI